MEKPRIEQKLIAALPLQTRRRTLRAAWLAQRAFGGAKSYPLAELIGNTLRMPAREARRSEDRFSFHDELTSLEWLSLLIRSHRQLVQDGSHVRVEQAELLQRAAASGKPIVLATIHMGNYVLALACLMHRYFRDRPMLIIRARDDQVMETKVMERIAEIGIDMRFLKVSDKADYIAAARFARKGAVVIYFVDLPPSYGNPIDVRLFGKQVQLAFGIDVFARLVEATVIPFSTGASLDGDIVHLGVPFEVVESGAAERTRVAARVTAHLEQSIARHPEQWHMWTRFSEFEMSSP